MAILCVWETTVQTELYLLIFSVFNLSVIAQLFFFLHLSWVIRKWIPFLEVLIPQAPKGLGTPEYCNGFQNRIPVFLIHLINWANFLHIQERVICQGVRSFCIQIVSFKYQMKCCYVQGTVLGYAREWINK